MAAAVLVLPDLPNVVLTLGLEVATGVAVYTAALAASWLLAGRPDGLERLVLERLSRARG